MMVFNLFVGCIKYVSCSAKACVEHSHEDLSDQINKIALCCSAWPKAILPNQNDADTCCLLPRPCHKNFNKFSRHKLLISKIDLAPQLA